MESRNDIAYETYESEPTSLSSRHLKPFDDLFDYVREYTREKPEVVALTCFCVGFILGWKLKPW